MPNNKSIIFTKEFDEAMTNLGEKNYSEVNKNLDDITDHTIKLLDPDLYEEIKREQTERKDCFIGDEYVKRDIAIEIMAEMIARRSLKQMSEENPESILKLEEELNVLSKERDEMYGGNKEIIEKILTVYSKEIRKYYKNNG